MNPLSLPSGVPPDHIWVPVNTRDDALDNLLILCQALEKFVSVLENIDNLSTLE